MSAAALVACGDKVEILPPPEVVVPTFHVTSVTVSGPTTYQLGTVTGNTIAYGFTLVADAGYTGARTVSWSSSNTAVATINSTTGVATALAAGSTVISATSTTDGVVGQLVLTVSAAPAATPTTPASVVVSGITQGANGPPGSTLGANVDLGNTGGQIDVRVDVSYNTANRPATISLDLIGPAPATTVTNCDSRPFGAAGAAADADVSVVTMSCLTASYDAATGVTRFKNGTYTLRASLGGSTTATTPAVTQITVNNADFIRINKPSTIQIAGAHPSGATGAQTPTTGPQAGFVWNSGSVQVNIIPVLYTAGRTANTVTAQLFNASSAGGGGVADVGALVGPTAPNTIVARSANNAGEGIACGTAFATATATLSGAVAITFGGNDSTTAVGVENVMVDTVVVGASITDTQGNALTLMRAGDATGTVYTAPTAATCVVGAASTAAVTAQSFIRLDNRDPGRSNFDPRAALQGANNDAPLNSAWLGTNITFPTTVVAGNGLLIGADIGANANTVTYQYAAAGTLMSATTGWTTVTAPSGIPASAAATAYNLRIITRDILGNADTSFVTGLGGAIGSANTTAAQAAPSTVGVDLTLPTVVSASTTTVTDGRLGSALACTRNADTDFCQRPTAQAGTVGAVSIVVSDPASTGGVSGSGFPNKPILMSIRRVLQHPVAGVDGVGDQQVLCEVPAFTEPSTGAAVAATSVAVVPTDANYNCTTMTAVPQVFTIPGGAVTQEGDTKMVYSVVDQANNRTTATTVTWYSDNTAPTFGAQPMAIPATITGGTSFTTSGGTLKDNMDIWRANGYIRYPVGGGTVKIVINPTTPTANPGLTITAAGTSVAFDQTVFRRADATLSIPTPFFRAMSVISAASPGVISGTAKPDTLAFRAIDRAFNLGTTFGQALPASNISGTGAAGYTIGTEFNAFQIGLSSNSTTSTTTTITARVTALNTVIQSPFTSVCFYYEQPALVAGVNVWGNEGGGTNVVNFASPDELVQIGSCSSTPAVTLATTGTPPDRFFDYTTTFTPTNGTGAGAWGNFEAAPTAGGPVFGIRAIGVNAAGDAIITAPPTGAAAGVFGGSCFRQTAGAC